MAKLGVEAVLKDASKGRFLIAEVMPAAVQPDRTFLTNMRIAGAPLRCAREGRAPEESAVMNGKLISVWVLELSSHSR